jgi:hypothetical protein
MKFGKTYEEKDRQEKEAYASRMCKIDNAIRTPVFAWLPIKLNSGKFVWFEWINMYETLHPLLGPLVILQNYEEK